MAKEWLPNQSQEWQAELDNRLLETAQGYQIGMQANGHLQRDNGKWEFDRQAVSQSKKRYYYQNVSFFGPNLGTNFFSDSSTDPSWFIGSFVQTSVANTIHALYEDDPQIAMNVSYLLGGFVRDQMMDVSNRRGTKGLQEKIDFTAQMSNLAQTNTTEAVASVIARYLLSGGESKRDNKFDGEIYHMAEAVSDDPIKIKQTRDLGISQVARLRSFLEKMAGGKDDFPDLDQDLSALDGFPTVGAEFHFTPAHAQQIPDLWKKLAVLNLSQYHRNSAIQLSRDDQGVVEVRMNPSVYPVTIANWNYLRLLMPELNRTSFTITLNRNNVTGDFKLGNEADEDLIRNLKGLGLLNYVRNFEESPGKANPGQIPFGTSYLGQTVAVNDGKFAYRGQWANGSGSDNGQIGIYAGIGDSLPDFAYYLSMALHKPTILRTSELKNLRDVHTLSHAYHMTQSERRAIFQLLDEQVGEDSDLHHARIHGNSIMAKLNP